MTTEFQTLTDVLLARRDDDRHLHFIDGEDDHTTMSFGALVEAAHRCLGTLAARGLRAGDELVIFTDNNREFLTAFWGAILGGIVPVPVAVGISDEHRQKLLRILQQLERPRLVSNSPLFARLEEFAREHGDDTALALVTDGGIDAASLADGEPASPRQPAAEDRVFVQFSSGSTSEPKGVCLTHANMLANVRGIIGGLALDGDERSLSWMPLTHDMGLIGFHISMFTANMDHALMDTSVFVRRPLLWLQKVSELRATVLCSPNFGYKHYLRVCERKGPGDIDLSCVRLLLNGAEPISVGLCDEFLAAMAPHGLRRETMLPVYGLAEATLAVTIPELGREFGWITVDRHRLAIGEPFVEVDEDHADALRFVRCGRRIEGIDFRIADDADKPLADGRVGHVQIRGPSVTAGIYGDDADTAGLRTADGWLRTGDCAAVADDQLVITGRHKEIIIVNGQNYSPHDVEEVLASVDGLELGKVVVCGAQQRGGRGEELLVFVLYRKDAASFQPIADAVRRVVGTQIGLEIDHVIPVSRIPKTTSGKVQRKALAQAYTDGEFAAFLDDLRHRKDDAGEPAGDDPVLEDLRAITAEFSKDKVVGPDDNLFEAGLSSLTLTEIMLAIDERYPGKADINDLFDYPTIRELAQFLRREPA